MTERVQRGLSQQWLSADCSSSKDRAARRDLKRMDSSLLCESARPAFLCVLFYSQKSQCARAWYIHTYTHASERSVAVSRCRIWFSAAAEHREEKEEKEREREGKGEYIGSTVLLLRRLRERIEVQAGQESGRERERERERAAAADPMVIRLPELLLFAEDVWRKALRRLGPATDKQHNTTNSK